MLSIRPLCYIGSSSSLPGLVLVGGELRVSSCFCVISLWFYAFQFVAFVALHVVEF